MSRDDRTRLIVSLAVVFALAAVTIAVNAVAAADDTLDAIHNLDEQVREDVIVMERGGRSSGSSSAFGDPDASGLVAVEIVHASKSAPATLRSEVRRLGGLVAGRSPGVTLVRLSPEAIPALAGRGDIDHVRVPLRVDLLPEASELPISPDDVGDVHVAGTGANVWHSAGYIGADVKVGIIDYFDGGTWSRAESAGHVPTPTGTFCRFNGVTCNLWTAGSVHGVAVAEVIHDMAPGAKLYLATVGSVTDLAAAVEWFDGQGVQIISRSLGSELDGPGDGTGSVDAVVDDAISRGMAWFNASGNHASASGTSLGTYWRGGFVDADGDGWMEFSPGDETLGFYCGGIQGFRWSDWLPSGRTDYDVYVLDTSGDLLASSVSDQTLGAPPLELLGTINCNVYPVLHLGVYLYDAGSGTSDDILEFMVNGGGFQYSSNPYSASHPASDSANSGVVSVGAIDPAGGITIAPYSSQGPTNDGRTKPDLSAPSCLPSFSYSPYCFDGTSGATPVAAGAAALIWGAGVQTTPVTVADYLRSHALDLGASGPDNVYGYGELSLGAPPDVVGPTLTDISAAPTIVSNDGTGVMTTTVTAEDAVSGVSSITATWKSVSDGAFEITLTDPVERESGTAQSGVWTGAAVVPVSAETGTWILERVRIIDVAANTSEFFPDDLTALGIPLPEFIVSAMPSGGTFVDDNGNPHESMIEAIAAAGITAGCATDPPRYCPSSPVKRLEMAVFLIRTAGEMENLPLYQGYFADVAEGEWYTPWVERLFELGITEGCGLEPRRFCPEGTVSRLEMATFIVRLLEGDGGLPPYQGTFIDVPEGEWWTPYVERLFQLEVTKGCLAEPAQFCPMELVFRDQMASFLGRAAGLDPIPPPAPSPNTLLP